jgi:hypothetical protein
MRAYPNFRDLEIENGLAWPDLVALEPKLAGLLWRARQASVTCRRWSDVERAFGPVRNELTGLIGFAGKHQRHPVLGSVGAYAVAHWKLYDAVAGLLPGRDAVAPGPPEKHGRTVPVPRSQPRRATRKGSLRLEGTDSCLGNEPWAVAPTRQ